MICMKLSDISVNYQDKKVLQNVSVLMLGGQLTSIIGPNGTGKTTLLKAVAGLVKYKGVVSLKDGFQADIGSQYIAYVPQMVNAVAELTVFEMVLLGQVRHLRWKIEKKHLEAVSTILEELKLSHLAGTFFSKLSGGQKQLVSMAQALVAKPKVLLLDEPTSALDLRHQLQVLDIAQKYTRKTGGITIVVLHDLALAARYSDSIILLNQGKIAQNGSAEEVLKAELLQKVYQVEVDVSKSQEGYTTVVPMRPCAAG